MTPAGVCPRPFDGMRAGRALESLAGEGVVVQETDRKLLEAAFGNSGFLSRLALREPAAVAEIFAKGPKVILSDAIAAALKAAESPDVESAMTGLRRAKRRAALAIALADIGGLWSLDE